MNVVIVESPAKAKTINKYLGPEYTVVASYGHVRDLPAKDGSVRPDEQFAMTWEVDAKAKKHLDTIAKALKGADKLYLATDPDREGEAISWHVCQALQEKKALNKVDIKRVVFNEITRRAIVDAFAQPRELDSELVSAYLARRALDYLVGFTLSPVLWRKLPGSRSAGRVQSVALRLVCERENEIEDFRSQEYWSVKGLFRAQSGETFQALLTRLDGNKLEKLSLGDRGAADRAVAAAEARTYTIGSVERKATRRHPAPPFITSTLQQEASRKLSLSATNTMRIAQRLYEGINIGGETVGLITYMRTDGVQMAPEAVSACRSLIQSDYGERYLPEKPRIYKSKAKNAQEAHEAIRPTDLSRSPGELSGRLEPDQLKLYTLIWKRTVASQMESAVLDQVAADVVSEDGQVVFRATGSTIAFDGFLKLYREGRDDPEQGANGRTASDDDGDATARILPDLKQGEAAEKQKIEAEQHFTQPPPRFTEASLVKRLEELGIGRPSTYASIIQVLQDRNYVRLESRRFVPEDRGRLVTAFLSSFFERYVAYGFTADMESKLDDISGGRIDWKVVLDDFWRQFHSAVDEIKDLRVKEVLDALDRLLGPHFFRETEDGSDPRVCPACADGRLNLKLGRYGAFIGCSNYPDCRYTRPLVPTKGEESAQNSVIGPEGRVLGDDPETGLPVSLRKGPYGIYVQLGPPGGAEDNNGAKEKPKRVSLPRGADPEQVDLKCALAYLSLPRLVGRHPDEGEEIIAGLGRYGPFLRMDDRYVSLKGDDDVLTIGLNRAVDLMSRARAPKTKSRTLGDHPADGAPVVLRSGRYGPYVQHKETRATVPASTDVESLQLDAAVALLADKAGKTAKTKSSKKASTAKAKRKPKQPAKPSP
ncbi:MAG: type I DNA topoisomerase [Hyphomicrobiales bacterium]|nr:type I DNA topoisomerase [Hyphomicrobiales bacterium]